MAITFSKTLANLILGFTGGSDFKTALGTGFLEIYSGTRPANPETDEDGAGQVKLVIITNASGATGVTFEDASAVGDGVISKTAAEVWSGTVLASGLASWFRFYAAGHDTGADTTHSRFDGSCGSAGTEDLVLANATLASGATLTIDVFNVALPVGTYA